MDKYEYKIRADEIKELISQGEYAQAAEIADTIDWRRVKSVMMLCTISDLYKINRRYEDARDMLLLAYERRPGGRTICYSLCELSIKMEEFVQAIEYYKEFVQVAPKDPGRYILQYKLYEAQDVSLEERIAVLEELKKRDYREKWAYELAYLYHRVGLAARCVEECDELILWFGEGKYVIKAMELKMLHQPLTAEQQEKYDHRFDARPGYDTVQQEASQEPEATIPEQGDEETGNEQPYGSDTVLPDEHADYRQEDGTAQISGDTRVYEKTDMTQEVEPEEELDIHVKTMDVGQYNTINLQAELAAGLREVLAEEHAKEVIEDPITRSIVAPMMESDTETLDYPEIDEVSEDDLEPEKECVESSEVFFGETGELGSVQAEMTAVPESDGEATVEETTETANDATAEIVMEQLRQENTAPALTVEPPKELAGVLSQESDGQISLVMPEAGNVEKQITGQMSIEDILAEWERMKKENQEKREEEVRQHVLQQTGTMFTEFEASVRDGLLEQLERGKDSMEGNDETEAEEPLKENENTAEDVVTEADEVEELEEIEEATFEAEETVEEAAAEETEEEAEEPLEAEETVEEATAEETEEEAEEPLEAEETVEEAVAEETEEEAEESLEAEETVEEAVAEETEEEAEESLEVEESVEEALTEEAAEAVEENLQEIPAVERDRAKLRPLTREERELYAPFIQSRSAREQLVKAIDNISLAAYTGNVIITGEEGMDTLSLAKNMIREIQATDSNFSGRVAKISGHALNKKDTTATLEQLKNGALIIVKASEMNEDTVKVLYKALQQESQGIVIVLEDTRKAMDHFLEQHEKLRESFTARMDVEALSNDTLVAFGRQYAREMEYSIDELGVLALHTRIADLQTIDHVVTVVEVKKIVDEAIRHANKKNLGHFFDILLGKRYDEEDMIILSEKDFA